MIAVYYGQKKPTSANDLLRRYVDELKVVIDVGFTYEDRKIGVSLSMIICDAPAKSFVLYIKGHNGFSSCPKCTIVGKSINRTTCCPYEEVPSRTRTDEDFVLQSDEDYHRGQTILTEIPNIGLVTNVALDYMHLVCLGTVKKLILLWLKRPLSVRINNNTLTALSKHFISMRNMIPSEFSRKPRELTEISNWKATEFRQFLLYSGPITLKSTIKKDIYTHFLTLHVAISILVSPLLVQRECNIKYTEDLLIYFVKNFGIIYGQQFISHNIHNLLHLCNDVRKFGVLDNFSAFPFENFLCTLKNIQRKPEKPLQQLARRYGEQIISRPSKNQLISKSFILQKQHCNGPLLSSNADDIIAQYKVLKNKCFCLNCGDMRNNCLQLDDNSIIVSLNIVKTENNNLYRRTQVQGN